MWVVSVLFVVCVVFVSVFRVCLCVSICATSDMFYRDGALPSIIFSPFTFAYFFFL